MTDQEAPRRGRPPNASRVQEEGVRRRRRDSNYDRSTVLKLGVDPDKLDKDYEYRWINEGDNSARLATLHQEDWDQVKESEVGSSTKVAVGTQKNGRPEFAYLCKKRKEFCEEDRAAKHRKSEAQMNALRKGETGKSDGLSAGDKTSYIPDEGISISG